MELTTVILLLQGGYRYFIISNNAISNETWIKNTQQTSKFCSI